MTAKPHGEYSIQSLANVLYIRLVGHFDTPGFLKMNEEVLEKRKEFGGTAFLQILDLRQFDLDDPEAMAVISDKAKDPKGINPASSVVVADSDRLKELIHQFYALPDRPVYPVTYRDNCDQAFQYFVEQGLLGEKRAEEWQAKLGEFY